MDLRELIQGAADFLVACVAVLAWWAVVIIFGLGVGQ